MGYLYWYWWTETSTHLTPRSHHENLVKSLKNYSHRKSVYGITTPQEMPTTGSCLAENSHLSSSSTTPSYIEKMRVSGNSPGIDTSNSFCLNRNCFAAKHFFAVKQFLFKQKLFYRKTFFCGKTVSVHRETFLPQNIFLR